MASYEQVLNELKLRILHANGEVREFAGKEAWTFWVDYYLVIPKISFEHNPHATRVDWDVQIATRKLHIKSDFCIIMPNDTILITDAKHIASEIEYKLMQTIRTDEITSE